MRELGVERLMPSRGSRPRAQPRSARAFRRDVRRRGMVATIEATALTINAAGAAVADVHHVGRRASISSRHHASRTLGATAARADRGARSRADRPATRDAPGHGQAQLLQEATFEWCRERVTCRCAVVSTCCLPVYHQPRGAVALAGQGRHRARESAYGDVAEAASAVGRGRRRPTHDSVQRVKSIMSNDFHEQIRARRTRHGCFIGNRQVVRRRLASMGMDLVLVARRVRVWVSRTPATAGCGEGVRDHCRSECGGADRRLPASFDIGLLVSNGFGLKGDHSANDPRAMANVDGQLPYSNAVGASLHSPVFESCSRGGIVLTSSVEALIGCPSRPTRPARLSSKPGRRRYGAHAGRHRCPRSCAGRDRYRSARSSRHRPRDIAECVAR